MVQSGSVQCMYVPPNRTGKVHWYTRLDPSPVFNRSRDENFHHILKLLQDVERSLNLHNTLVDLHHTDD